MCGDPQVSIICNVYNHGKYVRDALEGFISQKTNFTFEVLVHDDASTDDSAAIIREYEQKYPDLIKPIYQTVNQYSQKVLIDRTFQLPRIKGKYVATCEGDDYWTDPMKLQKQYDFMEAHPEYALCTSSADWLDMRSGKILNLCKTEQDRDVSMEEIILETKGRPFQYATFFTRTEIRCTMPKWTWAFGVGDTPLALHAATCGKVRMLSDCMAVYRNNAPDSWTSRISTDNARKIAAFNKMIGGLEAFNEATNHVHDEVVSLRIKRLRYFIARSNRDWKAMRSSELREIYEARGFKGRMSDALYCIDPRLQMFITRILTR